MTLEISFSKAPMKKAEAAILCFYEGKEPSGAVSAFNYECGGFIDRVLEKSRKFEGKFGQTEIVFLPPNAPYAYAVLAGLGKRDKLNAREMEKLGGKLSAALEGAKIETAEFYMDNDLVHSGALAAHVGVGMVSRSYKFEHYKSEKPDAPPPVLLKNVHIVVFDTASADLVYDEQYCVLSGMFFARDLVNEPPNELYPESYARRIKENLKPLGVEIDILDEKKMAKLGMGAILAVGQGSERPPRMVIMRWRGNKADNTPPLAFVGKGVTFDTGGISLKPGPGMEEMKMDMGGSAAVVGLMMALAMRKAKVNVVAIVGLAENMPSGRACRPADIITSYAGKTVEILNTDAEGRLVLADALTYIQRQYKPRLIIDLATLTGAMMIALGHEYCGTFVTDDTLWAQMDAAGKDTGEKLWRMPLDEFWKSDMEGTVSDLQNMSKVSGRLAGSCTAAGFLWHFIEGETPWAHMDIAGTAWVKADGDTTPKYGTGFGVRVLDRMIAAHYEAS